MESHKYQLKQGENIYIFQTSIEGNSIHLSVETPQKKIVSRNLSPVDLQFLDNLFSPVEKPSQGIEFIDKVLTDHKVAVKEENQNIIIIFYIKTNDITNKIEIPFGNERESLMRTNQEEILQNVRRSSVSNVNINNEEIPVRTNVDVNFSENNNVNGDINQNVETNFENYESINFNNIDTNTNHLSPENETKNYDYNNINNNEILNIDTIKAVNTFDTTTTTETTAAIENNYEKLLPTKYLPIKFIDSKNSTGFNTETKEYTTTKNTNYLAKTPIIPNQSTKVTTTNIVNQNEIKTSFLLPQTFEIQTLENKPPLNENTIVNLNQSPFPNIPSYEKKNDISALIEELNKLKKREIEELKIQINKLMNIQDKKDKKDDFKELKQKEEENYLLKKKLKESEKYKKQYEQEIKSLRATKKSSTGLDSKNIIFEEKNEKIYVKGDIIHSPKELEMLTRKINNNLISKNKKLILNLLYKATIDSDKAFAFHDKCDGANRTIVLIETDKGKRFGGYTSKSWKGDCLEKKDEEAFVFSLDKMKTYDNTGELAIGCYPKFGPIFMGCQIRIYDNAFTKGGTTFEKGLNYQTEEDFELNGGERNFLLKEIEVYEVIPQ